MASGKHEAVAVEPSWVLRIVAEVTGPERMSHRSRSHRHARMPRVRFLNRVHREPTHNIDTKRLNGLGGRHLGNLPGVGKSPGRSPVLGRFGRLAT